MKFKQGDIVQIVDEKHAWFPSLLVVEEPKSWGVQAYAIVPKSNDGSEPIARAFNRLNNNQVEKVGEILIGID
jgi:hypothetical protein